MTPLELLGAIRGAGGSVVVVDGKLRIKVPVGLLTEADRSVLVEHKVLLVRLLAPEGIAPATDDQDELQAEREAIQSEDEAAAAPPGPRDFPPARRWWWSLAMSDDDNRALDEFMEYGEDGPARHEVCFKCRGCGSFIGYGARPVLGAPGPTPAKPRAVKESPTLRKHS